MEIGEIVLVNFFIGFVMAELVIISGHLRDIKEELEKLNENRE